MPSVATILAVTAAAVLASAANAVPTSLSRACVLDAAGHSICSRDVGQAPGLSLSPVARVSDASYCTKGVDLTNAVRRRHAGKGNYAGKGDGDLMVGTESMLANAVKHSKTMSGSLGMEHQNLGDVTAEVGCDLFINRENIAMFGGQDVDPAEKCMQQWEDSEGHLDNIMNAEEGDYVVVGVYETEDGAWWCTQTFALQGDGNCETVSGSSAGEVSEAPSTSPVPATTEAAQPAPTTQQAQTTLEVTPAAATTVVNRAPATTRQMMTFMDEDTELKTKIVADGISSEEESIEPEIDDHTQNMNEDGGKIPVVEDGEQDTEDEEENAAVETPVVEDDTGGKSRHRHEDIKKSEDTSETADDTSGGYGRKRYNHYRSKRHNHYRGTRNNRRGRRHYY